MQEPTLSLPDSGRSRALINAHAINLPHQHVRPGQKVAARKPPCWAVQRNDTHLQRHTPSPKAAVAERALAWLPLRKGLVLAPPDHRSATFRLVHTCMRVYRRCCFDAASTEGRWRSSASESRWRIRTSASRRNVRAEDRSAHNVRSVTGRLRTRPKLRHHSGKLRSSLRSPVMVSCLIR